MTQRGSLTTCLASESVGSLVAKNVVDQFSYVPVVREGHICGLYNAERWFGKAPLEPEALVGEDFEPLSEDQLIGADVSIQEFVLSAAERPARLVVSGSEIRGLGVPRGPSQTTSSGRAVRVGHGTRNGDDRQD